MPVFYFTTTPVYGEWAKQTFWDLSAWMSEYDPAMELSNRCVPAEDGVYTGRVFSSKAFFQIARQLYPGAPFADTTDTMDRIIAKALHEMFVAISPEEFGRPGGGGSWLICDARTICIMALRLLGEDSVIQKYRDDCFVFPDHTPRAQQRYNEVGAWMLNSAEYKKIVAEGKDWQLLVSPPKAR